MNNTSNDITGVVDLVAHGAISQAEETEGAAYSLNTSIQTLNSISERENQGKDDLEASVIDIRQGFANLKTTSNRLNSILDQFSKVKQNGLGLQTRAEDVTNIVALNASIEASSQEVSANVMTYAEEIKKMSHNISEFKKVSKEFGEDLETYIL